MTLFKVTNGYCNWKDATLAFRKHKLSKAHCEAVEAIVTLPKITSDLGQLLSSTHKREKENARDMLMITLSSIRYLARQGLALRGDDEVDSNFMQLLILRCENNSCLKQWLDKSQKKYTSHENQKEMLQIMSSAVVRKLLVKINRSPFLTLMVDETSDKSSTEQLTFVIRWINDDLEVGDKFLEMYSVSSTTADSIVEAIKDILLHFQIPVAKI